MCIRDRPYGAKLLVEDGKVVKAGQILAEWDATSRPILTEFQGRVKLENVQEDVTVAKQTDDGAGSSTSLL